MRMPIGTARLFARSSHKPMRCGTAVSKMFGGIAMRRRSSKASIVAPRGFVDSVVIEGDRYLDVADELYQRAPVRHLVLSEVGERVIDIARDPHLVQLASLTLANTSGKRPIGDAGLAAITASPHLRELRKLEVAFQRISKAGVEVLCKSTSLPSLVDVNLTGNQFDDPQESYGEDWATGRIISEEIYLPPFGKELEAKYGDLPWLHGPSRLRNYPVSDEEL